MKILYYVLISFFTLNLVFSQQEGDTVNDTEPTTFPPICTTIMADEMSFFEDGTFWSYKSTRVEDVLDLASTVEYCEMVYYPEDDQVTTRTAKFRGLWAFVSEQDQLDWGVNSDDTHLDTVYIFSEQNIKALSQTDESFNIDMLQMNVPIKEMDATLLGEDIDEEPAIDEEGIQIIGTYNLGRSRQEESYLAKWFYKDVDGAPSDYDDLDDWGGDGPDDETETLFYPLRNSNGRYDLMTIWKPGDPVDDSMNYGDNLPDTVTSYMYEGDATDFSDRVGYIIGDEADKDEDGIHDAIDDDGGEEVTVCCAYIALKNKETTHRRYYYAPCYSGLTDRVSSIYLGEDVGPIGTGSNTSQPIYMRLRDDGRAVVQPCKSTACKDTASEYTVEELFELGDDTRETECGDDIVWTTS